MKRTRKKPVKPSTRTKPLKYVFGGGTGAGEPSTDGPDPDGAAVHASGTTSARTSPTTVSAGSQVRAAGRRRMPSATMTANAVSATMSSGATGASVSKKGVI